MLYDRKIKYLDYYEGGTKINGGGFAKLEVRDNILRLELTIRGLRPTDSFERDIVLQGAEKEETLGKIHIQNGCGQFRYSCNVDQEIGATGIFYSELCGIRISIGGTREILCKWGSVSDKRRITPPEENSQKSRSGSQETEREPIAEGYNGIKTDFESPVYTENGRNHQLKWEKAEDIRKEEGKEDSGDIKDKDRGSGDRKNKNGERNIVEGGSRENKNREEDIAGGSGRENKNGEENIIEGGSRENKNREKEIAGVSGRENKNREENIIEGGSRENENREEDIAGGSGRENKDGEENIIEGGSRENKSGEEDIAGGSGRENRNREGNIVESSGRENKDRKEKDVEVSNRENKNKEENIIEGNNRENYNKEDDKRESSSVEKTDREDNVGNNKNREGKKEVGKSSDDKSSEGKDSKGQEDKGNTKSKEDIKNEIGNGKSVKRDNEGLGAKEEDMKSDTRPRSTEMQAQGAMAFSDVTPSQFAEGVSKTGIQPEERSGDRIKDKSDMTQDTSVKQPDVRKAPVKLMEDKWQQLSAIYPHIQPFRDERDYLSLTPSDFVLFPDRFYRAVNNSFLLHGYYNYHHLILARIEHRGEILYYIGVPGNYFEREKQVAIMFGFESFECEAEPAKTGDFGYYMMRTEL